MSIFSDLKSIQDRFLNNFNNSEKQLVTFQYHIPIEIRNLLWFIDGPYRNYENTPQNQTKSKIVTDFGELEITCEIYSIPEPSAISFNVEIKKPPAETITEPPSYFPSYTNITPHQRWIYLNWLRNIYQPIHISYVFIFYYGLERHLYLGNFEKALYVILKLRKIHPNLLFLSYSANALMFSCIFNNRSDLLQLVIKECSDQLLSSNIGLLVRHKIKDSLSIDELFQIAKSYKLTNKKIIKENLSTFLDSLAMVLKNEYGTPCYPLEKINLNKCPICAVSVAANISLESLRSINIPNIKRSAELRDDIKHLFSVANTLAGKS